MKASQIVDNVRKNWKPIVGCVAAALGFYLAYLSSTMDKKSFSVPLKIEARNGMVAASSIPATVKVTIRGKPESITSLHESDFYAYLDLNYLAEEGTVRLPVQITLSENAVVIDPMEITVTPEQVPLTVEEQISSFVPVHELVSGEPAYGYELKGVELSPSEAKITGPRSMVQNCQRLQTREFSIAGAKADVSVSVAIENPGIFLTVETGASVTATAKISAVQTTKKYTAVPVNFSGLRSSLEPSGSIAPISLSLRGSLLTLEQYTPRISTVLADCSAITEAGTFDVPLKFNLGSGLTVLPETPKTVSVTVKEKPEEEDTVPAGEDE